MTRPMKSLLSLLLSTAVLPAAAAPVPSGPPPHRILSLAPHVTETLFALGLGERVIGRTDFCAWPAEARDLPSVGGLLNVDWERVFALDPDLAICITSAHDLYAPLTAAGIPVLQVQSDSIAQVRDGILAIAGQSGALASGEALVGAMDARMTSLAASLEGIPPRRTLLLIGREPGTFQSLYAAGPTSFVSELAERAGAVNVLENTLGAYPEISREIILGSDPEVIIDTCLENASPTPEQIAAELALYRRELPGVDAVVNGRVRLLTDPRLTIPGPRLPEQIELLARVIHPEAFARSPVE